MNVTDPIRRHAKLIPDATAVVRARGDEVSYRELDRTIDAVARRVRNQGFVPGDVVALAVAVPYRLLVLMLAFARAGVATAAWTLPAAHVAASLTQDDALATKGVPSIAVDDSWFACPAAEADAPRAPSHGDAAAILRVFASSGTTGDPKHVAVSHALMARRVMAKLLFIRPPDHARQICTIGVGTYHGFATVLRILWLGGTVILVRTAQDVAAAIVRFGANSLVTVPATLERIVDALPAGGPPLPELAIEVGGSKMPDLLYENVWQRLGDNLVTSYGATEASSIASAPRTALDGHTDLAGYVHPGFEVQAVGADDAPLPAGNEGILRVRSDLCVTSYVGDLATSSDVFRDGWFYPGDVGTIATDGRLTVTGRTREFINAGGEKIAPHRIEEVLLSLGSIREAAAFGVPDAMGVTQVWAAVVPAAAIDIAALDALCRTRLRNIAPKFILQLPGLPRNDAGKIRRDDLVAMATAVAQRNPGRH